MGGGGEGPAAYHPSEVFGWGGVRDRPLTIPARCLDGGGGGEGPAAYHPSEVFGWGGGEGPAAYHPSEVFGWGGVRDRPLTIPARCLDPSEGGG